MVKTTQRSVVGRSGWTRVTRIVLATAGLSLALVAAADQPPPAPSGLLAPRPQPSDQPANQPGTPSAASPEELQRLQSEVRSLRDETSKLREEIAALRLLIEHLVPKPRPEVASAPARAETPADPFASPASLLAELRSRYRRDFAGLPTATEAQLQRYQDFARKWCKSTNSDAFGKGLWLVRIDFDDEPDTPEFEAMLTVVDATSRLPIGDSFAGNVPRTFVDQVRRAGDGALYELKALMTSAVRFNAERHDRGVWDYPPMVGAYVEFGFKLEWQGLAAVRDFRDDRGRPDDRSAVRPATPATPR